MNTDTIDRWMEGYIRAWGSNDPEEIATLFTEDARYYTAPHREPWKGRQEIVEGWLGRKDDQGRWDFRFETVAHTGDLAFVRGWTTYHDQELPNYSNLWVLRLTEDGRCSEFTEWWMEDQED
jgi:uncharacterized protein (TIGR02246 family)